MTDQPDGIVRTLRDFCEMGLEGGDADPLIEVMHSVAAKAAAEIERLRGIIRELRAVQTTVIPFPPKRRHDTDADFVEACAGYVRVLRPEQEAHGISREDLDRLVRIAQRAL